MRNFSVLRDEIKHRGALLIEEHLDPGSFGSAYALFEGAGGRRFRLIWDGKEGCGFLQGADPARVWNDLPERVRGTSSLQSQQMSALLSAAEALINGAGAA